MAASPDPGFSLIFPFAEQRQGDQFRALTKVAGETLIYRAWRSFIPFRHLIAQICFIYQQDDQRQFDVENRLRALDWGVPVTMIRLQSATAGPADTVAQGVRQQAITGPAIICDIDHRLDLAPFFHALPQSPAAAHLCVWPLAGESLKRWSIACLDDRNTVREVTDRKLPAASGSFFCMIGCHHFPAIDHAVQEWQAHGFVRFSQIFNHLTQTGRTVRAVHLETAEFFGDAEWISAIEAKGEKFRGTVFCDIDGTILEHQDIPDYSRPPQLLPGSLETLHRWIAEGYYVVLCTARKNHDEAALTGALHQLGVPFHHLVTGLPSGPRVVINDRKPSAMFAAQALSLEIARNQGIASLNLPSSQHPSVLRRFEGGSFAETLLLEQSGQYVVRKRATKHANLSAGYARLKNQFRTLNRFAQLCPGIVPRLYAEEDSSHEYFYDMEFLDQYRPLSQCDAPRQVQALDPLMEQFDRYVYCHRTRYPALAEDWFLKHLNDKIYAKIDILAANDRLRPLLIGEGVTIDGVPHASLETLLGRITAPGTAPLFQPRCLALVHGDLTFQNIMAGPDGVTKVIDMESTDSPDALELDLGKLFQSVFSGYDEWSLSSRDLCRFDSPQEIRLNFAAAQPPGEVVDAVLRRWSDILECSRDLVRLKGSFYLGLHLVRMVPFRLKAGEDQAAYALTTAIQWLARSLEMARA